MDPEKLKDELMVFPDIKLGKFCEEFILLDTEGEPIPNQKYKITTESGNEYRGKTDEYGRSERVFTKGIEGVVFEYDFDA